MPYTVYGTLYPPLANLIFFALYLFVPVEYAERWPVNFSESVAIRGTSMDLRVHQASLLIFIVFFILSAIMLFALIDYALVEESRFVRQVLETAILDQVCERATPADISQLRQNVRLQALTQEPEMSGSLSMMELDDAFHQILFRIAQKENTFRMLGGMTIHFDRVRTLALNVVKDTKIIIAHQLICDAIANRDV